MLLPPSYLAADPPHSRPHRRHRKLAGEPWPVGAPRPFLPFFPPCVACSHARWPPTATCRPQPPRYVCCAALLPQRTSAQFLAPQSFISGGLWHAATIRAPRVLLAVGFGSDTPPPTQSKPVSCGTFTKSSHFSQNKPVVLSYLKVFQT